MEKAEEKTFWRSSSVLFYWNIFCHRFERLVAAWISKWSDGLQSIKLFPSQPAWRQDNNNSYNDDDDDDAADDDDDDDNDNDDDNDDDDNNDCNNGDDGNEDASVEGSVVADGHIY